MSADIGMFPLRGGLQVAAPRSLELITPYVLEEQQDWFEDEIRFVRRLLRPGQRAIDIGANYGVYALTMGRLVGPAGLVVALEPARDTAACLQRSVQHNGLENVRVIAAALSDREGQAELCVGPNAELNSLAGPGSPAGPREVVALHTLDGLAASAELREIDFVKLDAEGEESRILDGGQRFFEVESPLLMFELKHGDKVNLPLIAQVAGLGYRCYRLVPGLGLLAPFSLESEPDPFQLNLFACKPDRAARLAALGLLAPTAHGDEPLDVTPSLAPSDPALWQLLLCDRPYFRAPRQASQASQASQAPQAPQAPIDPRYAAALSSYARAHGLPGLSPGARLRALSDAFEALRRVVDERATLPRAQSLARVAWELGHRLLAVQLLSQLGGRLRASEPVSLGDEPFLPVGERFDLYDGRASQLTFVLCSVLEQREKLRAFSSYYTGQSGSAELQQIWELGQGGLVDDEIGRRLQLIRRRHRPG